MKTFLIAAFLQILFAASLSGQKYENGTRLLKGAEVLSATPLQLDYVLETLADTANITVNIHEGKTHLVLNDGSGEWREWWYHEGRWKLKTPTIPPETDPTVPEHVKGLTENNISDWYVAYDKSHTHNNKTVIDGISSTDVTNWDIAHSWGNHATQGYLKTETDPVWTLEKGNYYLKTNLQTSGQSQVHWDNITNKPAATTESDPTVPEHVKSISATNIANWNTAYTNNHTHSNKTVIDDIASTDVTNWNTAHGWGNHATQGYLKTETDPVWTLEKGNYYLKTNLQTSGQSQVHWDNITNKPASTTESDPTVPNHVKSITTANIANWNTAYGWGNHATQGYLKNYTLPVASSSVLGGVKTGSRITIATDGTISANPQAWTDITGKPTFATVATSGNYNDLTNRPSIPTAYTLPPATTTTLGGVKVGSGLSVTADGTLSSNANVITYGTFTPTIMGGSAVTYTLGSGSTGKWWRNNRVVHMEIAIGITSTSGTQGATDIMIGIPDALSPINIGAGGVELRPAISIQYHSNIMTSPNTQLGGFLEGGLGVVRLMQSGTGNTSFIRHLPAGSNICFSITYIL